MLKPVIVFVSIVAGMALFGAIVFMQRNPRAFTSEPKLDLDAYLYSEVAAKTAPRVPTIARFAVEPTVVLLPPLHIVC